MVSHRCKMMVIKVLKKLRLSYVRVDLGIVELREAIYEEQIHELKEVLLSSGLEVMEDKKSILIEKIKNVIVELVHYSTEEPDINFSGYLSKKLGYDYTYLANIFSVAEGITIEKFIIRHKIEKAKELLRYQEITLTEIANKLHYSSVAHLSNQFKKVTGLTPTSFKRSQDKSRMYLESI